MDQSNDFTMDAITIFKDTTILSQHSCAYYCWFCGSVSPRTLLAAAAVAAAASVAAANGSCDGAKISCRSKMSASAAVEKKDCSSCRAVDIEGTVAEVAAVSIPKERVLNS
jgi:hypothetical protein